MAASSDPNYKLADIHTERLVGKSLYVTRHTRSTRAWLCRVQNGDLLPADRDRAESRGAFDVLQDGLKNMARTWESSKNFRAGACE
jgi:hypothetical protein